MAYLTTLFNPVSATEQLVIANTDMYRVIRVIGLQITTQSAGGQNVYFTAGPAGGTTVQVSPVWPLKFATGFQYTVILPPIAPLGGLVQGYFDTGKQAAALNVVGGDTTMWIQLQYMIVQ